MFRDNAFEQVDTMHWSGSSRLFQEYVREEVAHCMRNIARTDEKDKFRSPM